MDRSGDGRELGPEPGDLGPETGDEPADSLVGRMVAAMCRVAEDTGRAHEGFEVSARIGGESIESLAQIERVSL